MLLSMTPELLVPLCQAAPFLVTEQVVAPVEDHAMVVLPPDFTCVGLAVMVAVAEALTVTDAL